MTVIELPENHPHLQPEQALIGAILDNSSLLTGAAIRVTEDCFADSRHKGIWQAFIELESESKAIDLMTVAEKAVVEPAYLVELVDKCPVAQNMSVYSDMVLQNYGKREAFRICATHAQLKLHIDPLEVIKDMQRLVDNIQLSEEKYVEWGMNGAGGELVDRLNKKEPVIKDRLNQSSYPKLNEMAPICRGDLVVIGAVSSGGKTAFTLRLCHGLAANSHRGIYFYYESSTENLQLRVTSMSTKIPMNDLKNQNLSPADLEEIKERTHELGDFLVYRDVSKDGDIDSLLLNVKNQAKKGIYDYIVIDHMHSMPVKGRIREGTIDITKKLLMLAKQHNVAVIALAQFKKQTEGTEKQRPTENLIRESSTIRQDAHHLWLLHDAPHLEKLYPDENKLTPKQKMEQTQGGQLGNYDEPKTAEIIINKNREGECGSIPAVFNRPTVTWGEL